MRENAHSKEARITSNQTTLEANQLGRCKKISRGQLTTPGKPKSLVRCSNLAFWIRSQNLHKTTVLPQHSQSVCHLAIGIMAVAVHEEKVFPSLAFARSRFDFRHVDTISTKRRQSAMQRTHLIHDTEHHAGAVFARGRTALTAKHQESGRVRRVVLNIQL